MLARARPIAGLGAVLGVIAAVRLVVDPKLPVRWQPPVHLATAVASLGIARAAGASAAELGLERKHLGRGVLTGAAVGGLLAGSIIGAGRHRRIGPRLAAGDASAHSDGEAAFEAAVRIPLNTALYEELVFRGAVLGLTLEVVPVPGALALTSALFGLWHLPHVVPVAGSVGPAEGVAADGPATVAVTTAGGALFAALRLGTGSVAAPVMVHALLNSSAFLAARAAAARHSADSG